MLFSLINNMSVAFAEIPVRRVGKFHIKTYKKASSFETMLIYLLRMCRFLFLLF